MVKEAQEFLSSSEQKFLPLNSKYDKNKILSSEEYIEQYNIEVGNLVITKENFNRYFNIFNRHDSYKDNPNKIASELFNYHVRAEDKDSMREWLIEQGYKLSAEINNGKIKILPQTPSLSDLTESRPVSSNIAQNDDLSNFTISSLKFTSSENDSK